jgi:hypothetical protein
MYVPQALRQELDYAEHLGLPAILLPPAPLPNQNFACFMNAHFHNYTTSQYWLRVPLSSGMRAVTCLGE